VLKWCSVPAQQVLGGASALCWNGAPFQHEHGVSFIYAFVNQRCVETPICGISWPFAEFRSASTEVFRLTLKTFCTREVHF